MNAPIAPVCEPVRKDDEPEPESLVVGIDMDNLEFFKPVPVVVN